MKYFITFLILITINLNAQNDLKFDKRFVQSEDKWVAFPADSLGDYDFGFIYIDSQAGLTLDYSGTFKIDNDGKFIPKKKEKDGSIKYRLEPNNKLVAFIPESKFEELHVDKFPDWLKYYKGNEESIDHLYRWGYLYNEWNECEKALTFLEKAEKINANFKGLQTELAFSYNALGKYSKAEIALNKAIKSNPNDCYSYKELAYANMKLKQLEKAEESYNKMVSVCKKGAFILETSYNLTYEYFILKDKTNFEKWKKETKKWTEPESKYSISLEKMGAELNK